MLSLRKGVYRFASPRIEGESFNSWNRFYSLRRILFSLVYSKLFVLTAMQSCFFFCLCAKTSRKECNATFFSFFAKHQFPYSYVCAGVFLIIFTYISIKTSVRLFLYIEVQRVLLLVSSWRFSYVLRKAEAYQIGTELQVCGIIWRIEPVFSLQRLELIILQIFYEAGDSRESIFPCHLSWCLRKILKIYRVWFQMLKQCPSLLVLRHEGFAARRKFETGQRFTRGSASNWWSTFQMGA